MAPNVYRHVNADGIAALPAMRGEVREEDRLAVLFDTHEARLYRLARRLTPSAADADDLVQETFLRAAGSLRSIPTGRSKEEAWLVRVLINIQRDQWRRRAVRRQSAPMLGVCAAAAGSPADAALIAKQTVWAALDALHPKRRSILVLHELDGMSLTAIAGLLGISAVTVRWHLSMGRRELRRLLKPAYGELR